MAQLCILILSVLFIWAICVVPNIAGNDKKYEETIKKIRTLYEKTAPDNMRCWFKWGKLAKTTCKEETTKMQHQLLEEVQKATKENIIKPVAACHNGFAEYYIGVFEDPASLPCSEDAFKKPAISDEEATKTYKNLLKLFNNYDSVFNTKSKREEAGKKLVKAIQEAENKNIIPKSCNPKTGTGFYSLYTGMPLTEMPCMDGKEFKKPKSEKPLDKKKLEEEEKKPN